eukprot:TRINITY_DN12868_c0_g1_i1.p1 TRINITY_DN12868_c0_g1~~TRINITY_DN12868_c0_g1_i1.p1  ORF type:complete len:210 (-),score=38.44 TRINITY_DN12868_c0_g1_i1:287-847(-)
MYGNPSKEDATKLHETFVPKDPSPANRTEIILVIRKPGMERSFGNTTETQQWIDLMQSLVKNHTTGTPLKLTLFWGTRSFQETIELFSRAAVVIGTLGAGHVNSMFAPSSNLVVEINGVDRKNGCHYITAKTRGMEFYQIECVDVAQGTGEGALYPLNKCQPQAQQVIAQALQDAKKVILKALSAK